MGVNIGITCLSCIGFRSNGCWRAVFTSMLLIYTSSTTCLRVHDTLTRQTYRREVLLAHRDPVRGPLCWENSTANSNNNVRTYITIWWRSLEDVLDTLHLQNSAHLDGTLHCFFDFVSNFVRCDCTAYFTFSCDTCPQAKVRRWTLTCTCTLSWVKVLNPPVLNIQYLLYYHMLYRTKQ